MKKAFVIALTVLMLVSVLCVGAFADGATLQGDRVESKAGATATVGISVASNPGTQVVRFKLDYDRSVLTLQTINGKNGFTVTEGEYILLDAADYYGGADAICELVFKVADDAKAGEYPVKFSEVKGAIQTTLEDVDLSEKDGAVIIKEDGTPVNPTPTTAPGKTDPKTSPKTGDSILSTLFVVSVLSGAAYVTVSRKKFAEN